MASAGKVDQEFEFWMACQRFYLAQIRLLVEKLRRERIKSQRKKCDT